MLCHSSLQACRMLHTHTAWPGSSACCNVRRRLRTLTVAMARPWRPEVDDVDRLAKGGAAKKRGTGNRNIPHRLNSEEKPVYDSAKKKGYLAVKGTGYRRARKGNPLPNIYRQWCDARATPCIVVEQPLTGSEPAVVVVDLAPLRLLDCSEWEGFCRTLAAAAGAKELLPPQRTPEDVPFNIIPLASLCEGETQEVLQLSSPHAASSSASAAAAAAAGGDGLLLEAGPSISSTGAAAAAVADQAAVVKALKDSGLTNQDPDVQREVQMLLKLKRQLQELEEAEGSHHDTNSSSSSSSAAGSAEPASSHTQQHSSSSADTEAPGLVGSRAPSATTSSSVSSSSGVSSGAEAQQMTAAATDAGVTVQATAAPPPPAAAAVAAPGPSRREVLPDGHPYATVAIWQLPARPLFFEVERTAAKQLAKDLMAKAR